MDIQSIISLTLRAIAMAMGVAAVVLGFLGSAMVESLLTYWVLVYSHLSSGHSSNLEPLKSGVTFCFISIVFVDVDMLSSTGFVQAHI